MNVLKTLARYFRFISISAFIFAPIFPLVMFALSKIVPSADADMQEYLMTCLLYTSITGSGGLSLAKLLGIRFEQEVIACSKAVETLIPETDVAIELGGEDAKITFYLSLIHI